MCTKNQMHVLRAGEPLQEVPSPIDVDAYNSSINRAYFTVFHAMKAVEALDNSD